MRNVTWKQHDTGPCGTFSLKGRDGQPADLTGATVRFLMRRTGRSTQVVVDAAATALDAAAGTVTYVRAAADTATPGKYEAEFEVTFADGSVQTFPEEPAYITVTVVAGVS